jgi:hypothetical protein
LAFRFSQKIISTFRVCQTECVHRLPCPGRVLGKIDYSAFRFDRAMAIQDRFELVFCDVCIVRIPVGDRHIAETISSYISA